MSLVKSVVVILLAVALVVVVLSVVGFVVSTLTFIIEVAIVLGLGVLVWRYVFKR